MRCDDVAPLLQDELDGLLLPLDRAAVEQHLEACRGCSHERSRLRALMAALERLPEASVPIGFIEQVMNDLPEMLPAREGRGHLVRWGLAAAAATAAFVALLGLLPAAGQGVAEETFRSLLASLSLGGSMISASVLVGAGLVDAVAGELAAEGPLIQTALCLVLFAAAALLALSLRWYRRADAAPGRA